MRWRDAVIRRYIRTLPKGGASSFPDGDSIGRAAVVERAHERHIVDALDRLGERGRPRAAAQVDDREMTPVPVGASAASLSSSRHGRFPGNGAINPACCVADDWMPRSGFRRWAPPVAVPTRRFHDIGTAGKLQTYEQVVRSEREDEPIILSYRAPTILSYDVRSIGRDLDWLEERVADVQLMTPRRPTQRGATYGCRPNRFDRRR